MFEEALLSSLFIQALSKKLMRQRKARDLL